jgi:hypothetical protein
MSFLKSFGNIFGSGEKELSKEEKEKREYELAFKRLSSLFNSDSYKLLNHTTCKIFTHNNQEDHNWLFSGITGWFALILDYEKRKVYIRVYEYSSYELKFEMEFYSDFNYFYKVLTPNFHSFELNKGHIGIKFENSKQANEVQQLIHRYTDDFQTQTFNNFKKPSLKRPSSDFWYQLRKQLSLSKKASVDDLKKYLDQNTYSVEIYKPLYFSMLACFRLDSLTKKFCVNDGNSDEIRSMLEKNGVIKSNFSNLTNHEMNVPNFKNFIDKFDDGLNQRYARVSKIIKFDDNKLKDIYVEQEKEQMVQKRRQTKILLKDLTNIDFEIGEKKHVSLQIDKKNTSNISKEIKEIKEISNNNIQNKRISVVPKVPSAFKNIPAIPKIPKMKIPVAVIPPIPKIRKLDSKFIETKLNDSIEENDEDENDIDDSIKSSTNTEPRMTKFDELQMQMGKLKKANFDDVKSIQIPLNNKDKTLNDVQFALQQQLKQREELWNRDNGSDEEKEEDDSW